MAGAPEGKRTGYRLHTVDRMGDHKARRAAVVSVLKQPGVGQRDGCSDHGRIGGGTAGQCLVCNLDTSGVGCIQPWRHDPGRADRTWHVTPVRASNSSRDYFNGNLAWVGRSLGPTPYWVQVSSNASTPATYNLSVSGNYISFPTGVLPSRQRKWERWPPPLSPQAVAPSQRLLPHQSAAPPSAAVTPSVVVTTTVASHPVGGGHAARGYHPVNNRPACGEFA